MTQGINVVNMKKNKSRLTTQRDTNQMLMVRKSVQPLMDHQGQCNNKITSWNEELSMTQFHPPNQSGQETMSRDDGKSSHKTSNPDLGRSEMSTKAT